MAQSKFDIIIVGAGPAGSSAAFTAAKEGISVLLLEEHPEIGIPLACAEGLSRSTIKGYLEIRPEWVASNLTGSIVRGPDGDEFKIEYPDVGWVLNRKLFDRALAKNAEDRGVIVKTSTKAIGIEDNEVIVISAHPSLSQKKGVGENGNLKRYRFKFLIGADGITSNVGRWLDIDTRLKLTEIEVCAQYLIEGIKIEPNYAYFIVGNDYTPGGYAWIFPKSANSANVGLGITPLKTKRCAKYFLDEWVKKDFPYGIIKEKIFGGASAKVLKRFSGKNFFLIGDAARFTDPLSGAGIANGIKSGVIAGTNAVLRIRSKKDYFEAEIEKEILNELRFHAKIRDAYLKLAEKDYKQIFNIGKRIFAGKTISDINTRHVIKEIIFSAPHLLPISFKLLF